MQIFWGSFMTFRGSFWHFERLIRPEPPCIFFPVHTWHYKLPHKLLWPTTKIICTKEWQMTVKKKVTTKSPKPPHFLSPYVIKDTCIQKYEKHSEADQCHFLLLRQFTMSHGQMWTILLGWLRTISRRDQYPFVMQSFDRRARGPLLCNCLKIAEGVLLPIHILDI